MDEESAPKKRTFFGSFSCLPAMCTPPAAAAAGGRMAPCWPAPGAAQADSRGGGARGEGGGI